METPPPAFSPDNSAEARNMRMRAQALRNTSDYTSYDHALAWVSRGRILNGAVNLEGKENEIQPATGPGHSGSPERPA